MYSYSKKTETGWTYAWRCTSRNAATQYGTCNAIVKQRKTAGVDPLVSYTQNDFVFVKHDEENHHVHPPVPGIETKVEIYARCKKAGLEQKFRPAGQLITGKININFFCLELVIVISTNVL